MVVNRSCGCSSVMKLFSYSLMKRSTEANHWIKLIWIPWSMKASTILSSFYLNLPLKNIPCKSVSVRICVATAENHNIPCKNVKAHRFQTIMKIVPVIHSAYESGELKDQFHSIQYLICWGSTVDGLIDLAFHAKYDYLIIGEIG